MEKDVLAMFRLLSLLVLGAGVAACSGKSTPDDAHHGASGDGDGDGDVGDGDGDTGDGDGDGDVGDGDGDTGDGDGDGDTGDGDGDTGDGDGDGDTPNPDGVIRPSAPESELVKATEDYYDKWKQRYVVDGCRNGEKRVKSEPDTDSYTVSEAHGYGMLFTVLMAKHDASAQSIFDGMFSYYRAHQSDIVDGLMAWAQDKGCDNVGGDNAATDGDLDIAFALLLAHSTWGSTGAINYESEAARVMDAILEGEVAPENYLYVGDWVQPDDDADGTRASDFMLDHFRAFAQKSENARWTSVLDKTYAIVASIQENHSSSGLLPDFILDADGDTPTPPTGKWLEGKNDGKYSYNACRVPWRLTGDYLLYGEPRARTAVRKMTAFIRQSAHDDPHNIVAGYTLSGEPFSEDNSMAFVAPFAAAAMIEPEQGTNQAWLDSLWEFIVNEDEESYYSDSIKLGTMLVVSGLYHAP
jgi:endo-1,4-beta-D-glucanase Y